MPGSVIILNGASSSGKSTIARAAQTLLPTAFWHYSIDHLLQAGILPQPRIDSGEFSWTELRPGFFEGFHRSIPALVEAGNNLIVEHIIETREWMDRLALLLDGYDVFMVGVHCPLDELERREVARGDRRIGEAKADFETAHLCSEYDMALNGMDEAYTSAERLITAWQSRSASGALSRMAILAKERGAADTFTACRGARDAA